MIGYVRADDAREAIRGAIEEIEERRQLDEIDEIDEIELLRNP